MAFLRGSRSDDANQERRGPGQRRARRRSAPRRHAVVASGLLGRRRPPVKRQTLTLEHGDVVVFATDGIGGSFVDSLLLVASPQATAEHALDGQCKPTNEGLVLGVCHLR